MSISLEVPIFSILYLECINIALNGIQDFEVLICVPEEADLRRVTCTQIVQPTGGVPRNCLPGCCFFSEQQVNLQGPQVEAFLN